MSVRALIGAVLLATTAAACGGNGGGEPTAKPPAAVGVTVAQAKTQEEPVTLEATGSFEAEESSDVAPDAIRARRRHAG